MSLNVSGFAFSYSSGGAKSAFFFSKCTVTSVFYVIHFLTYELETIYCYNTLTVNTCSSLPYQVAETFGGLPPLFRPVFSHIFLPCFPSKVLIPNKYFLPSTLSQHLLLEKATSNNPLQIFESWGDKPYR